MNFATDDVFEIALSSENHDQQVRVVLPDRHVMAMRLTQIVEACRIYTKQMEFGVQFEDLLYHLGAWIGEREAAIGEAYLTTRDTDLLFLVVTKHAEYDPSFEEDLTELDLDIANNGGFPLIRLNVLAIPPSEDTSVRSFLSRDLNLKFKRNGI